MSPTLPAPMDVRLMNIASLLLGLAFVGMLAALGIGWLVQQNLFRLTAIKVRGDVSHNNAVTHQRPRGFVRRGVCRLENGDMGAVYLAHALDAAMATAKAARDMNILRGKAHVRQPIIGGVFKRFFACA